MKSYKAHFRRFVEADPGRVHLAAHSHHFWPDVTFDAHARAWTDAATLADDKWDRVFSKLYPRCQRHVARLLRLPDPSTVAFAPNTHELVMRVVSCLPERMRVLTTDGEFHSFSRQLARLEEAGRAEVVRVPTRPLATFRERWTEAAEAAFDLVYLSQVFFDSGFALRDLEAYVPASGTVIVDGYHAFCAIDVDLSKLASRIFYVAGGYKYAMSGEGCCFLHAPPGAFPRPVDTGWFAAFFAVVGPAVGGTAQTSGGGDSQRGAVPYADDGSRFLGATFDPSGLYRFDAAMGFLEREGVTARDIDARAKTLQRRFVEELGETDLGELVVPIADERRGSFLVFESSRARELHDLFASRGIMTDVRGTGKRQGLRVGFGLYHDESDVVSAVRRMVEAIG